MWGQRRKRCRAYFKVLCTLYYCSQKAPILDVLLRKWWNTIHNLGKIWRWGYMQSIITITMYLPIAVENAIIRTEHRRKSISWRLGSLWAIVSITGSTFRNSSKKAADQTTRVFQLTRNPHKTLIHCLPLHKNTNGTLTIFWNTFSLLQGRRVVSHRNRTGNPFSCSAMKLEGSLTQESLQMVCRPRM